MRTISIDNHLLIWGVKQEATPGQEPMIEQTILFLEECYKEKTRIIITPIVLAEFLTGIEPKNRASILNTLKTAFIIPPFDSASAIVYAKIWQEQNKNGKKQSATNLGATRQELKADCMIVATSIAHKADAIFSHDIKLKAFAEGHIQVLEIPKYQIQKKQTQLSLLENIATT